MTIPTGDPKRRPATRMRWQQLLLRVYAVFKRYGVLEWRGTQWMYSSFYFAYKRHLEDPFYSLCRNHPALFADGHIVDVGANIGYTTVLFAKSLSPSYKVIAFEPEAHNFCLLRKNISRRRLHDRVDLVHAAVGETRTRLPLWQNRASHADHKIATESFCRNGAASQDLTWVDAWSVDHYFAENAISHCASFIKIDVQGFELPVLGGMQETLARSDRTTLALEFSPADLRMLGYEPRQLLRKLSDWGYNFYLLEKTAQLPATDMRSLEEAAHEKGYVDFLCRREPVPQL